jgi:NIMA (never in mitosis gene a)-related kinase 1/4/5
MLQHCGLEAKPTVARKSGMYTCLNLLGKGTYGTCYKVLEKHKGMTYVMKVIPLADLGSHDIQAAFSEAVILSNIKHPNVVGYCDAWVENSHLYIVMNHCNGGDLACRLQLAPLSVSQVLHYARDISCGMQHLHRHKIMHRYVAYSCLNPHGSSCLHKCLQLPFGVCEAAACMISPIRKQRSRNCRDLKPSNLFLHGNRLLIGDLGLGKRMEHRSVANTQVGTPLYFSPEVCREKPYGFPSDVWAFGYAVMLLQLALHCNKQVLSRTLQLLTGIVDHNTPRKKAVNTSNAQQH